MAKLDRKYVDYPSKVLSGKIVAGKLIKLACKRYFDFLKRKDMYFDTDAVDRVVNFISKLKHFTGEHNQKPFTLSDWQFWLVCSILAFKWKKNGYRVCRTAFIEVGRKSGKSSLLAALSAYCLVADKEHNAQVVFSANSAKQASLCFQMTSNFLQGIDPKGKYFKRLRDKIKFDATKSEIIVTSSDASKLDGLNCSMFCVDELEEAKDGKLWNVLETSQGMRTQPLAIAILTAGFNLNGFAYQMRLSNMEVLHGKREDDTLFSAIYELDEEDDVEDPKVWKKACPNLDITVKSDYLQQQLNRAKNNPSLQTSVYTKLFDKWLASSEEWLPAHKILEAQQKWEYSTFSKDYFSYLGVDLGSTGDLTCVSVMVPVEDKFYFRNYYFLPSETLKTNENRELYKIWKEQGHLITTEGNVTDYNAVIKTIMDVNSEIQCVKIAYDAWNSTQWACTCTEQGLPVEPFSQSMASMNRPSKELERLIMSGKVILYPNPIDRFCFSNVVIKRDYNDNIKITKQGYNNKIDGCVAMVNALGIYLTTNHYTNDIYTFNIENNN